MPRMNTCAAELFPVSVPYEWNCKFGATLSRSVVDTICRCSSASALRAVTATGVSWRLSRRRRAVTTMDSSVSPSPGGAVACCATARPPAGPISATPTTRTPVIRRKALFVSWANISVPRRNVIFVCNTYYLRCEQIGKRIHFARHTRGSGAMRRRSKSKAEAEEPLQGPQLMLEELDGLLGYRLRRAQGAMHRDYMAAAAGLELTQKQTATLWLIHANPGVSQVAVAATLGM